MNKRSPKVLFAAGGSGGHIFPAVAVAQALRAKRSDAEIAFVGTSHRMESRIAPEAGFRFIPTAGVGFPRGLTVRWIPALGTLAVSMLQAARVLRVERPSVVFGTGGFVCGPTMMAAAISGVPTIIHESNAAPGMTNRWLSKVVTEIHIAFEDAGADLPSHKVHLTGNPIRYEIIEAKRLRMKREAGDRLTLLVVGGSQGARSFNTAMVEALPELAKMPLRILHQTGLADFERTREAYRRHFSDVGFELDETSEGRNAVVTPFVKYMGLAYQQADFALSRSGAITISELTLCGLPSILVPLPIAKTAGERRNAQAVANAGAGVVVEDAELTGERLIGLATQFLTDRDRLRRMSANSANIAKPNATRDLVAAIEKYLP